MVAVVYVLNQTKADEGELVAGREGVCQLKIRKYVSTETL